MEIQLLLTHAPVGGVDLKGKTVVVIDVLRSSTSICAMLHAGAKGVIPTAEPGEAGDIWARLGAENAVLAGERQGVKVENFQYGNSPFEFTAETVGGKYVILCTTNGTGIFGRVSKADCIIAGGVVNMSPVAQEVASRGNDLIVVCAGTDGGFSMEDTLAGGLLIHKLSVAHQIKTSLNDAGSLALLLYRTNQTALAKAIAQGEHARNLAAIGFSDDVTMAGEVDLLPVLPLLADGRLTAEKGVPSKSEETGSVST